MSEYQESAFPVFGMRHFFSKQTVPWALDRLWQKASVKQNNVAVTSSLYHVQQDGHFPSNCQLTAEGNKKSSPQGHLVGPVG